MGAALPETADGLLRRAVHELLAWYGAHARDLPWRRTKDPYAIWVSEIMLQQTQVRTVIPYWERWMKTFPDVTALAAADPSCVLKLWEGLGYYTRARLLHRAAHAIVTQHRGAFPTTFDHVLALTGIGRYTAGAICSIAFNQPTPILDGNVTRVLTRLFGVGGDPRSPRVNKRLWKLAGELVQAAAELPRADGCSQLNQALMELGALVCTPKQPDCLGCPLRTQCAAFQTGRVDRLPALAPRAKQTVRHFSAFVVCFQGKLLLRQRPANVVNGHLWEFPNIEHPCPEDAPKPLAKACLGFQPQSLEPLCKLQHTITRFRIHLRVFMAIPRAGRPTANGGTEWHTWPEIEQLAFPSAHGKILERLKSRGLTS